MTQRWKKLEQVMTEKMLAEHTRTRIVQWEVSTTRGHFPLIEEPERFVDRFRAFADAALG